MHRQRGFLFLQGLASPFFRRLGDQLRAEGSHVFRVNFCAGDVAFWGKRPAWNFRGQTRDLPEFLDSRFRAHRITDVILFGDRRPIHVQALKVARAHGARIHVFEEGYVRPNWITVERDGVNAHSRLPKDPQWYREVNESLKDHGDGRPIRVPLQVRAVQDLAYRMANLANAFAFPGYRTHRPHMAALEYAGWTRRFAQQPIRERADARMIRHVLARRGKYFLLPLQMNGDAQIIYHSHFRNMEEVIRFVVDSFAEHAPSDAELIVKNHPLDTGLVDYQGLIAKLRKRWDLHARLHFVESGHLPTLFDHAHGVVIVNSTVGMSSLFHGCPTKALANPIYALPGLTCSSSLNDFWNDPPPPDPKLFHAFRNTVIHATQVNGDFFTRGGIDLALAGCRRMFAEVSPLEELLQRFPLPE